MSARLRVLLVVMLRQVACGRKEGAVLGKSVRARKAGISVPSNRPTLRARDGNPSKSQLQHGPAPAGKARHFGQPLCNLFPLTTMGGVGYFFLAKGWLVSFQKGLCTCSIEFDRVQEISVTPSSEECFARARCDRSTRPLPGGG